MKRNLWIVLASGHGLDGLFEIAVIALALGAADLGFFIWILVSSRSRVKGAIAAVVLGPQVIWLGLDVAQQDAKLAPIMAIPLGALSLFLIGSLIRSFVGKALPAAVAAAPVVVSTPPAASSDDTVYAQARALHQQGLDREAITAELQRRGVDAESIRVIVSTLPRPT